MRAKDPKMGWMGGCMAAFSRSPIGVGAWTMFGTGLVLAGSALLGYLFLKKEETSAESASTHAGAPSDAAKIPEEQGDSTPPALWQRLLAPYQNRERDAQLEALSLPSEDRELERQAAIGLRRASLGLATVLVGGRLFHPLAWVGLGLTLIPFLPSMVGAIRDLFKKRHVGFDLLAVITISGMLAGGLIAVGAVGLWYVLLMKWLLTKTKTRSKDSLVDLFGEQLRTAWVLVEGVEVEVPIEKVEAGAIIIARAGRAIPVDGFVIQGIGMVDQRALTGEEQPIKREAGDEVYASTLLLSGALQIQVERAGDETVAAGIGDILRQTVSHHQNVRPWVEQIQDTVALPLLGLSMVSLPWVGVSSAIAILWYAPGFRMSVLGPMSTLNFLYLCAQERILVKDGRSLEVLRSVDTFLFDKTGTLTLDEPAVQQIMAIHPFQERDMLGLAASVEAGQSHPIARAIYAAALDAAVPLHEAEALEITLGFGIQARVEGRPVAVGSARFMEKLGIALPIQALELQEKGNKRGHSAVMVAVDGHFAGLIALEAALRPGTEAVIQRLKDEGKRIYIVSGDREAPTRHLAARLGVDGYYAEMLPEEKADLVLRLQEEGREIAFVGDGINDAIALKRANISISLSGATTAAVDAAQVVLMRGELKDLMALMDLAQRYEDNIRVLFAGTVAPNIVGILATLTIGLGFKFAVLLSSVLWVPQFAYVMRPLLMGQDTDMVEARSLESGNMNGS